MTRTARALVLCYYGLIGAAWLLLPSSEPRPALRTEMTAMPAPTSITPKPITLAPAVVAAPAVACRQLHMVNPMGAVEETN